jgi:hypothetical protein
MPIVTATANETIPTGEYLVALNDITVDEGQFGKQYKFAMEVTKPAEYAGKKLTAWTSTSSAITGKFMKYASAFLRRPIEDGERVNTDDLIGKQAIAIVLTKVSDKDNSEFNKVDGVKAYKARASAPAPVAPPPVEEDIPDITDPFAPEN